MRGRKPVPTALRILRGNPGKRPLPKAEPVVAAAVPEAPSHLQPEARAEWDRVVPELRAARLLTKLDRAALAAYCVAYGRWVEAELKLRELGVIVKAPSGFPMLSPYLLVANKALEQMQKALAEFGMSPSSRVRVTAADAAGDERGRLSRFLSGA